MTTGLIYCHTNKINNKKYIGQTSYVNNPNKRGRDGNGYKPTANETETIFGKAIKKYGGKNFEHEILAEGITSLKEADQLEKYGIKFYNTYVGKEDAGGYNMTAGGDSSTRLPLTDEHKKKISSAHIGKKLTQEHKDKISKKLRNKHYTEEEKLQLRENSKCKKAIKCLELDYTFSGLGEAERETGIKASGICHALKDPTKSAGKSQDGIKLHWRYIDGN